MARIHKLKVRKATAPSHWAPFLINGDSIDENEMDACIAWIERMGLGYPVSCVDAGFRRMHDASIEALPADCQEYTFLN